MKSLSKLLLLTILGIVPAFGQVETIQKLRSSLPVITDSVTYVDVVNRMSLLFYEQNIDSTFYYSLRARDIARRLNYEKGLADATNNLGIVFDIKGNLQLALRYYNDAYNQYVSIGDSSNIVQTLMNIATVYSVSGKDQKAVSNFRHALRLGNQISHDSITALVIYNFMLMYPDSLSGDSKNHYFQKADQIGQKYRDIRIQLALRQLRADNYIANNEREKGIDLLKQTLSETLNMKLYYLSMDLLIDLGDQMLASDPQAALAYYKQAMNVTEEKGYRIYAIKIGKKLSDFYSANNDIAMSYFYKQKLLTLYEEQMELDKATGIDYIEYAVKDQQLISAQIKTAYNTRLLWLALAVCVLTVLSVVFLLRNWLLTKRTNEVLRMQFKQLESTTRALESTNENYARIIKIVAHDLRNPIGGIYSMSSMLLDDDLDSPDAREFVELIHESSNGCIQLIGDLLKTDFNIKESELNKEVIDLPVMMQQAVKLLSFQAREKGQELILKDGNEFVIYADREKMLRVINNLVINAIKFSPEGGIIRISTQKSTLGITITIQDNGVGIPESVSSKIFDPFTSSKRIGTAGEQPVGLGLYISKQIVEAHHGRIWFESVPGKGATFFVFLPE